jgi:hypothetical protein
MTRYDWVPSALGRGVGGSLTGGGDGQWDGDPCQPRLELTKFSMFPNGCSLCHEDVRCTPKKQAKEQNVLFMQFSHLRKRLGDKARVETELG